MAAVVAGAMLAAALCCPTTRAADDPQQDALIESQLNAARDANARNRNASNQARNAGRDSIGKGTRNMNHGKRHHMHPQINMGAFQIAEGLLGLMASAQADKLAGNDSTIATGLDEIPSNGSSGGGTAPTLASAAAGGAGAAVSGSGQSSSIGASPAANSVKLSAEDFASADVKKGLAEIQDQFGYTPEKFVERLEKGNDPATLFTHAPLNALSAEEAKAAAATAGKAIASGDPAGASTISALPPGSLAGGAGEPGSAEKAAADNSLRDSLRAALARHSSSASGEGDDEFEMSPEVKAALASKAAEEAERAKRESAMRTEEFDLFQVVHLKYVEREKFLSR